MYTDFCDSKVLVPDQKLYNLIFKKFSNINLYNQNIKKCTDLNEIDETYLVTEKIDEGKEYFLFLTNVNRNTYSVILNTDDFNTYNMYIIHLRFDIELYKQNTLFKGTLAYNTKSCWMFYITDILNMGKRNININLKEKINLISDILKNGYVYDDFMNVFYIQLKPFYLLNHLDSLEENKTLMFYPNDTRKSILILKIYMEKEKEYKSGEYMVVQGDEPDIYKIYDLDTNKFINILTVKKLKDSKYLNGLFETNKQQKLFVEYKNKQWYLK